MQGGCCFCRRKRLLLIANIKKCSERRKRCALAVVRRSQKFSPRRRPLPGAQDGQNLISWTRSLYLRLQPTDPVWWRSMKEISSYRGNSPINAHTHTQTHDTRPPQTGPITIHCAARLSAQCNYCSNRTDKRE